MFYGELGFEKDVIGDFVLRDDKVIFLEFFSLYISVKILELVSVIMEFFFVLYFVGLFCWNLMMFMLFKFSFFWGYK